MRMVFMGTPEFAVASLDILLENKYEIAAVITAPDKPAGRGKIVQESAVKKYAVGKGLKILQPLNLKSEGFISELKNIKADLQIVVAFRMLPEVVWNMPRLGTYNLHASLLPAYRGAAPINWAIMNGESESGITTFKLKHEIDSGNILFQEKVTIESEDCAGDLHDKLMNKGAELILRTVQEIERADKEKRELTFIAQSDHLISHAPKLNRDNCRINWDQPVKKIHDQIRGLSPFPSAYTVFHSEGKADSEWKILKSAAHVFSHSETNGLLLTENNTLKVFASGGVLEILELQQQGKKRMPAMEFLKGFRLGKGDRFL